MSNETVVQVTFDWCRDGRRVCPNRLASTTLSRITAGGRMGFRPVPNLETGLSMVHEERDGDPMDLYGIDLGWRPRPGLQLRTEIASTDQGEGSVTAYRLELSGRRGANLEWDIAYRELPLDFANPTLLDSPDLGTRRASATARWRPSEL